MNSNFYRAFEDRYRGTRALIKERLNAYAPFTLPLAALYPGARTIDLGCGRGEWLELMTETGFAAHGVDLDEGMLAACHERGLSVQNADALTTLRQQADASVAMVSAFHLVEHLPFDEVSALIVEAKRVLLPGGLLIMETPNPENLSVGTHHFYLDPSHLKPIPPLLLDFSVDFFGFERHAIVRLQGALPEQENDAASLRAVFEQVSPDYGVVAQNAADPGILSAFDSAYDTRYGVTLPDMAARFDRDQTRIREEELEARVALSGQVEKLRQKTAQIPQLQAQVSALEQRAQAQAATLEQQKIEQAAALQTLAIDQAAALQKQAIEQDAARDQQVLTLTQSLAHAQATQATALKQQREEFAAMLEHQHIAHAAALELQNNAQMAALAHVASTQEATMQALADAREQRLLALESAHQKLLALAISSVEERVHTVEAGFVDMRAHSVQSEHDLEDVEQQLGQLQAKFDALLESRSWRITAPLRATGTLFYRVRSAARDGRIKSGLKRRLIGFVAAPPSQPQLQPQPQPQRGWLRRIQHSNRARRIVLPLLNRFPQLRPPLRRLVTGVATVAPPSGDLIRPEWDGPLPANYLELNPQSRKVLLDLARAASTNH